VNPPSGVLLDTNVLSYLLRQSSLGTYYERQRAGRLGYVACVTPEELYFGAEKRKWGNRKRRALDTFIAEYAVLPAGLDIARVSARLRAERERAGRALDKADAWIAATALEYGLPLFTHDGDFEGIEGLRIVTAPDSWVEGTDEQKPTAKDTPLNAAAFAPSVHLLQ
jgi:predicted nucleic acid-binding protein